MNQINALIPNSNKHTADVLSSFGINPTLQRQDIASLLLSEDKHLSAEDILIKVNKEVVRASKATVYNTLNLFVRKGLIREVLVDPQRVFYDGNTQPHYHMYNIDTKELTDIDAQDIEIPNIPGIPPDQQLDGIDIVIKVRNI